MIYIKQKENYEIGYDHIGSEVREETIIEIAILFHKHKYSVSDPSHFDVDPDPDPGIHIWEKWTRILGSTFP